MRETQTIHSWTLDNSTFINARLIRRVWLLPLLRKEVSFPEYVFKVELGSGAHPDTRIEAARCVEKGDIGVRRLTLEDLDRIAGLSMPRRIGLGEVACALIAEREDGGVLCDDRKARNWILERVSPKAWEAIEDLLIAGAEASHLSEYDLQDCQETLRLNKYQCSCDLRHEYLRRLANRKP
jgi:predicted nucleic acid-binding protein